jgi:hypothetical protein
LSACAEGIVEHVAPVVDDGFQEAVDPRLKCGVGILSYMNIELILVAASVIRGIVHCADSGRSGWPCWSRPSLIDEDEALGIKSG